MKKKITLITVTLFLLFPTIIFAANLGTLSHWNSDGDIIGRWHAIPGYGAVPLDSSMNHSTFANHISHASLQWSNAGVSHYGVDEIIYADIPIRGGNLTNV